MRPLVVLVMLLVAPSVAGLPNPLVENDAGSGGDAGDTLPFAIPIERRTSYSGSAATALDTDLYLFEGTTGERLVITIEGPGVCAFARTPQGHDLEGACDLTRVFPGEVLVTLNATGTHSLEITSLGSPTYRFGIDIAGDRIIPNDDAGTGRDAPDHLVADIMVPLGVDLKGHASIFDADHYGFHPQAGVTHVIKIDGSGVCLNVVDENGEELDGGCAIGDGAVLFAWKADNSRMHYLRISGVAASDYTFGVDTPAPPPLMLPAVDLEPAPAHPPRGADPTCGTGAPVVATSGEGDELDGLVYAALKTGFRAVVAWHTPEPTVATLTYSIDGGPDGSLIEATPRTQHVFVVDRLPENATLCFTPTGGAPRALRLANAMNDASAEGIYTTNLLVVANTQITQRADLEGSLSRFATIFRDATDGHLRAGKIILVYADLEKQNSGVVCGYASLRAPGCSGLSDVVYTYASCPAGAACAQVLGVKEPTGQVWMHSFWQSNAVMPIDDAGAVLAHEMGHYLVGARDLYSTVSGEECWDPARGLSIMSGSRQATEFDDEVNRCANEASFFDYVPAWTTMRRHYPLVPERTLIDAGPHDPGAAYSLHIFANAPGLHLPGQDDLPADDGGTGGDAPDTPDPTFLIEPQVVYDGTSGLLDMDFFAFTVAAGDRVDLAVRGALCGGITNDEMRYEDTDCSTSGAVTHARWIAPHDGIWYIRFDLEHAYRFSFGVNRPATVPIV